MPLATSTSSLAYLWYQDDEDTLFQSLLPNLVKGALFFTAGVVSSPMVKRFIATKVSPSKAKQMTRNAVTDAKKMAKTAQVRLSGSTSSTSRAVEL